MRCIALFLSVLFVSPLSLLAQEAHIIEGEAFESSLVPKPGFQIETTNCLVVQPTYDRLYGVFDAAEKVDQARSETIVTAAEFAKRSETLNQSLDGFELKLAAKDDQSPVKVIVLSVQEGEPILKIEWKDPDEAPVIISDPRALILIEDFLNLANHSELDRYQGALLHPFQMGDVSTRFQYEFNERKNRVPKTPSEIAYGVELTKGNERLNYDLASSLYGWMYRLKADESELPHAQVEEICVRFQCDARNLVFDREDSQFQDNQKAFSDFARQLNRLISDYKPAQAPEVEETPPSE